MRLTVTAVFTFLAVAIASWAVVAGVLETNRTASAKAAAMPSALAAPRPTADRPTRAPVASATSTPTATSKPSTQPAVIEAPQVNVPATREPAPERPRASPAPVRTCPVGTVTSTLTSIGYEEVVRYGLPHVIVTGRGTLTNGTSAAVRITQTDVPDLEGLDERGQIEAIETTGTYDWAPPPGIPSGGVIDLQPGQILTFTVVEDTYRPSSTVKYWYSSTESGSVMMYFTDFGNTMCHVFGMPDHSGNSIPNTFVPTG